MAKMYIIKGVEIQKNKGIHVQGRLVSWSIVGNELEFVIDDLPVRFKRYEDGDYGKMVGKHMSCICAVGSSGNIYPKTVIVGAYD